MKPLNYAFARERGVALQTGEAPVFLLREDADPLALVEARRAAGQACEVRLLEARAFDRALSEIYAFDGLAHSMSDSAEDEADTEDTEEGAGAALVAFVGGDPAVRAADLGEAELVAEVVAHLASTLGSWAHMYTGAGDQGPLHVS